MNAHTKESKYTKEEDIKKGETSVLYVQCSEIILYSNFYMLNTGVSI